MKAPIPSVIAFLCCLSAPMSALAVQPSTKEDIKEAFSGISDDQKVDIIMRSGVQLKLFNFETGETDVLTRPDLMEPDQFVPYIAPIEQIREFYFFLVNDGRAPHVAMNEANVMAMKIIEEDPDRMSK